MFFLCFKQLNDASCNYSIAKKIHTSTVVEPVITSRRRCECEQNANKQAVISPSKCVDISRRRWLCNRQKSRLKGVESAPRTGNTAVPVTASSDLRIAGGIAMATFGFPSPFLAPTTTERPSAMFPGMDSRTTTPAAPLLAPPPGTTLAQPSSCPASTQKFLSQMSALDLAQVVAGAIHGFKTEPWITEDFFQH